MVCLLCKQMHFKHKNQWIIALKKSDSREAHCTTTQERVLLKLTISNYRVLSDFGFSR